MSRRLLSSIGLGFVAPLLLTACASLGPEGAALSLNAFGLRRADLPGGEGVQWDYALIIENPNRRSATLTLQTLTVAWDGVYLAPQIDHARRVIPAHGSVWLPKSTVFRRTEFQASRSGGSGRPPDAPPRLGGMWISWQLLGQHESGASFLLNLDFFPDRDRAQSPQGGP
jgi:hypothetical protein